MKQYIDDDNMDDELKNNLSTVAVFCYAILSPYIAQYLTSEQFSALVVAVTGVLLVLYSERHPRDNSNTCDCEMKETILNDEYTVDPVDGDD